MNETEARRFKRRGGRGAVEEATALTCPVLDVVLENIFVFLTFSHNALKTRRRAVTIALSIVKKISFGVESWFQDHHWCLNTHSSRR